MNKKEDSFMKKLLSLILAAALMLGCMSIPALAAAEDNVPVIRMNLVNFYGNPDEAEVEDAMTRINAANYALFVIPWQK